MNLRPTYFIPSYIWKILASTNTLIDKNYSYKFVIETRVISKIAVHARSGWCCINKLLFLCIGFIRQGTAVGRGLRDRVILQLFLYHLYRMYMCIQNYTLCFEHLNPTYSKSCMLSKPGICIHSKIVSRFCAYSHMLFLRLICFAHSDWHWGRKFRVERWMSHI